MYSSFLSHSCWLINIVYITNAFFLLIFVLHSSFIIFYFVARLDSGIFYYIFLLAIYELFLTVNTTDQV